jgi:hypothetical protein
MEDQILLGSDANQIIIFPKACCLGILCSHKSVIVFTMLVYIRVIILVYI